MDKDKIVWLASYPKSGNTWFRAFITALLNDGKVDINGLKTDGIFSSRTLFEEHTDLDSALLYNDEAKLMQGRVFTHIAHTTGQEHLYVKIHDAYTYQSGQPVVPTKGTQCAIYFVRNPLDIAASLANHKNDTIDDAIGHLNDPRAKFSDQGDGLHTKSQLEQLLMDWSGHIESWTSKLPFPVLVIRYEDMLADPLKAFTQAIEFIGLKATAKQIAKAVDASSFNQLQQKEQENGFVERIRETSFFRKGIAGGWKNELNQTQVKTISNYHNTMMGKFGYTPGKTKY